MKMWFKIYFLFCLILSLISNLAFSQEPHVKKDSTILYKNIESFSRQSRFTRFMYQLVFKPVAPVSKKKEVENKGYKKQVQKPYRTFEGKIIRKIEIVTLDPFGYSVIDTNAAFQNIFYRAGNKSHVKSNAITIRNLLLFRKGEPFNSLFVKESERLIRIRNYVNEVSFYVNDGGGQSDSVDVFIRELDKWSIFPDGSISGTDFRIDLTDKNFLGSGHEFQNAFSRNFTSGINTFNTNYSIQNIRNTYISSRLHYGIDGYKNNSSSLVVERPFYSPLAKWAAGATFAFQQKNDSLKDISSVYVPIKVKFHSQDYWAGKAVRIFKANSEDDLITNLILTARYLRIQYSEKPPESIDPLQIYSNEDFLFAGIGISTRKFIQDKYIFKYGVIEDVPIGKDYGLTGGYQVRNNSGRFYLGTRFFFSNYFEWGYLSSNIEYGTFFKSSHTEQGVFTAGVNYSTLLFEIGKWKFRQFVKPQVSIGMNRFPYDSLTLKDGYGLDGFNSSAPSGTKRILLTLQTQSYSPWNFIGFHFGPFFKYSLGMLGDAVTGFKNSRVYSQIGLGVLIKNENLVFNTFQISISFYPIIPGIGRDIFKMNSFRTTDFGFRDFEIGKPATVIYQ